MSARPGFALSVDLKLEKIGSVILSDGRFADIHKPLTAHHLAVLQQNLEEPLPIALLISMITTIDGAPMSFSDVMHLEPKDYVSIIKLLPN